MIDDYKINNIKNNIKQRYNNISLKLSKSSSPLSTTTSSPSNARATPIDRMKYYDLEENNIDQNNSILSSTAKYNSLNKPINFKSPLFNNPFYVSPKLNNVKIDKIDIDKKLNFFNDDIDNNNTSFIFNTNLENSIIKQKKIENNRLLEIEQLKSSYKSSIQNNSIDSESNDNDKKLAFNDLNINDISHIEDLPLRLEDLHDIPIESNIIFPLENFNESNHQSGTLTNSQLNYNSKHDNSNIIDNNVLNYDNEDILMYKSEINRLLNENNELRLINLKNQKNLINDDIKLKKLYSDLELSHKESSIHLDTISNLESCNQNLTSDILDLRNDNSKLENELIKFDDYISIKENELILLNSDYLSLQEVFVLKMEDISSSKILIEELHMKLNQLSTDYEELFYTNELNHNESNKLVSENKKLVLNLEKNIIKNDVFKLENETISIHLYNLEVLLKETESKFAQKTSAYDELVETYNIVLDKNNSCINDLILLNEKLNSTQLDYDNLLNLNSELMIKCSKSAMSSCCQTDIILTVDKASQFDNSIVSSYQHVLFQDTNVTNKDSETQVVVTVEDSSSQIDQDRFEIVNNLLCDCSTQCMPDIVHSSIQTYFSVEDRSVEAIPELKNYSTQCNRINEYLPLIKELEKNLYSSFNINLIMDTLVSYESKLESLYKTFNTSQLFISNKIKDNNIFSSELKMINELNVSKIEKLTSEVNKLQKLYREEAISTDQLKSSLKQSSSIYKELEIVYNSKLTEFEKRSDELLKLHNEINDNNTTIQLKNVAISNVSILLEKSNAELDIYKTKLAELEKDVNGMINQKVIEQNLMSQNIRDLKSVINNMETNANDMKIENEELSSQLHFYLTENNNIREQSEAVKSELAQMEKSNTELVNNFKNTLKEITLDVNNQKTKFESMKLERDKLFEKYSACFAETSKYLKLIEELKSNEKASNSEILKLKEDYKICLMEKATSSLDYSESIEKLNSLVESKQNIILKLKVEFNEADKESKGAAASATKYQEKYSKLVSDFSSLNMKVDLLTKELLSSKNDKDQLISNLKDAKQESAKFKLDYSSAKGELDLVKEDLANERKRINNLLAMRNFQATKDSN